MTPTTMIGIGVIAGCALILVGLYSWSAHRIETIHRKELRGLRQIRKELGRGRNGND